jgi:hypothetical protein
VAAMATHIGESRAPDRPSYSEMYREPPGSGWVTFAATMLGLAGALNVIDGIIALSKSEFFSRNAVFAFSDLRTWAWIVLVLGIVQIVASVLLMDRSQLARWFGVAVASVNAIGQLLFVQAYPFWSLSLFAVDVLIIYGLTVHGGRDTRTG